jgi:hypothetical protein
MPTLLMDTSLKKIRSAKTGNERIQCIIATRKKGYRYERIRIAAGMTRRAVHQIIKKHVRQQVRSVTEHGLDTPSGKAAFWREQNR